MQVSPDNLKDTAARPEAGYNNIRIIANSIHFNMCDQIVISVTAKTLQYYPLICSYKHKAQLPREHTTYSVIFGVEY